MGSRIIPKGASNVRFYAEGDTLAPEDIIKPKAWDYEKRVCQIMEREFKIRDLNIQSLYPEDGVEVCVGPDKTGRSTCLNSVELRALVKWLRAIEGEFISG
jgi:hypothetical protein